MESILCPPGRVVVNVPADAMQETAVADDVVVEIALPHGSAWCIAVAVDLFTSSVVSPLR
ncbi:MAG: hypothetical protein PPP56_08415 [Longimonas sp.]|uniref:hypothetical protein n=1 Tax=Longimonas sp. TaxID=2039626 RepID=UPI00334816A6